LSKNSVRALQIICVIMVNVIVITLVSCYGDTPVMALSRQGSRGDEVKSIQTKLKQWGYYKGSVDGIYGTETTKAVKYFQQKNKLTVDGIAGPKTLTAMGISSSGASGSGGGVGKYSQSDYNLLARIISAEARGETYNGQVAVGAVVLNRVEHPSFPDSITGVVYENGAFSCLKDGEFNKPVADASYRAAKDALNGWDPCGGAIYYFNPDKTKDKWMHSRPVITRIGSHLFCK